MARVNFRVGYWNVYGAYSETNRDGFGKCPAQGALILGQDCDFVMTLENHEEMYTRKDGKREKAYMPLTRAMPGYTISEGDGGNQLYIRDSSGAKVIRKRNLRMTPGNKDARSASKWNLELGGVKFWGGASHFPAGQTVTRRAVRALQVPAFLAFMATVQRGWIAYDSNDFKKPGTKGAPQTLMELAGWKDMREKSLKPTIRGHESTSEHGSSGTWIENIRTRKGVRVTDSGLVIVDRKLSDHNFLWADLEIDTDVLLGKHD